MITSQRNQYRGINAHLSSLLQTPASGLRWEEFHTYLIVEMAKVLNAAIVPKGCRAVVEESLQIRLPTRSRRPESDVSMLDLREGRPPSAQTLDVTPAELVLPLSEVLTVEEEPAKVRALALREPSTPTPLIWVELLSASNKPVVVRISASTVANAMTFC